MGDLIRLEDLNKAKTQEERVRMVEGLRDLLARAEAGELHAVSYVVIPADRECLSVGVLKTSECGMHEVVGATTILSDYLRQAVLDMS
ncbi:hypothetical protein [Hyphomicrobium sp.]|uniref:hypothetical protein n=1 Tax=Hyphomicrobium sp. TaxID=82 RepID=UPI003F701E6C